MTAAWKYFAYRLNGDGTETFLTELPLSKPKLERELSGPGGIRGVLTPEILGLRAEDGEPLFVPWSTVIYAEKDGTIRNGGIIVDPEDTTPELTLDCVGFSGYLAGQPYPADNSWVGVDPLNIVRHLWTQRQILPRGNIGMVVDSTTTTPVKLGKPLPAGANPDRTNKDEGPYVLGWWDTHDLGKVVDDLATETPFDYVVDHFYDEDDERKVHHRLRFGYPSIGRRRDDLRFVVGENIFVPPAVKYSGGEYADAVLVLGAGEGRKMIRGTFERPVPGRVRRAVVVEDKSITDQAAAERRAALELTYRLGDADITDLTVVDHPHAPLGSYDVGDEIQVQTKSGWHAGLDLWLRIIAISTDPETNTDELTLQRSEKGQ